MNAAENAFAQTTLYTDETHYALIHLPAPAITAAAGVLAEIGTAFSALVVDKDEVSLVLPQEQWAPFATRLPDYAAVDEFRLITFDSPLKMDLVGFMAFISRLLADTGISLFALSAFERDHILVPAAQFQLAWNTLHTAQKRLQEDL